jgi:hypothetical protein
MMELERLPARSSPHFLPPLPKTFITLCKINRTCFFAAVVVLRAPFLDSHFLPDQNANISIGPQSNLRLAAAENYW